ncbi:MAG: hypothetical protein KKE17_10605 [Proteobacteria bacterium]|nr:hypothetical protein [Pseudomonadota bacterium]MBU1710442.1 hypothetical protein [Pseudomonadota bacterium]
MPAKPVQDLNIVGDFLKFFIILLVPFVIIGGVWGYFQRALLLYGIGYPLIYSIGISMIIIVINNDINDVLGLFGLGNKAQLSLTVKHAKAIQSIGILIGSSNFNEALKKVNALLKEEPKFPVALNMKGQILLEGFSKYQEARICFERVLAATDEGDEQHTLADSMIVECYSMEGETD